MCLLEVKNLTFGYDETEVLDDFSMKVAVGEILLIEGQNGAGKTTLLKCITNVINNGHNVFVENIEVHKNKDVLKNISFVMSEDTLYDYLTLEENIKFFGRLFGEYSSFFNKVMDLCKELDIDKYGNYLIKSLSQGTRNKLYLAIMLSKKHRILILDEPFTALDRETQSIMMNKIKNVKNCKERCVIMVTHVEEFKKLATRTVAVKKILN